MPIARRDDGDDRNDCDDDDDTVAAQRHNNTANGHAVATCLAYRFSGIYSTYTTWPHGSLTGAKAELLWRSALDNDGETSTHSNKHLH